MKTTLLSMLPEDGSQTQIRAFAVMIASLHYAHYDTILEKADFIAKFIAEGTLPPIS